MKKHEYECLVSQAEKYKQRRRYRYCDESEINTMRELDRKRSLNGKIIRVYSEDGFVPNGYKYQAIIDYVERYYDENGNKHFRIGQTRANRSNGDGAQITIDGRAY